MATKYDQKIANDSAAELLRLLRKENRLTPYQRNVIRLGLHEELVVGSYVILNKLNGSSLGTCFEALKAGGSNERDGSKRVVLRILDGQVNLDESLLNSRIDSEGQLQSKAFITTGAVFNDKQRQVLVTEHLDQANLWDWVSRNGPLSPKKALLVTAQITEALTTATQAGLVHSILNPSKIHIDKRGNVRIRDLALGAALAASESDVSSECQLDQSDFSPPELSSGRNSTSQSAVIYRLGRVFLWLLLGQPCFARHVAAARSRSPSAWQRFGALRRMKPSCLRPDLPKPFDAVLLKMVDTKPARRHADYAELHRDLRALTACVDGSATAPLGSRFRPKVVLAVSLAGLAIAGAIAAMQWPRPSDKPPVIEVGDHQADDVFKID